MKCTKTVIKRWIMAHFAKMYELLDKSVPNLSDNKEFQITPFVIYSFEPSNVKKNLYTDYFEFCRVL